jgi:hypothetical protein
MVSLDQHGEQKQLSVRRVVQYGSFGPLLDFARRSLYPWYGFHYTSCLVYTLRSYLIRFAFNFDDCFLFVVLEFSLYDTSHALLERYYRTIEKQFYIFEQTCNELSASSLSTASVYSNPGLTLLVIYGFVPGSTSAPSKQGACQREAPFPPLCQAII